MNLTLHLIRKDLRHLRVAIVLWGLFVCSQVVMSHWLLTHPSVDANWLLVNGMLFNLLLAVGLGVTYFLLSALVLNDPMVGTDIFWVTRPISSSRLMTAKSAVAVLVFAVLPLAIWSVWWLACDFSPRGFVSGALRLLGLQLVAVIPALAVSTLSPNLGRLLVNSFVLFLALVVASMHFATQTGVHHSVRMSRLILAVGVLAGTGIFVAGWMYRTRAFGRAIAVGSCGLISTLLAGWMWPFAWPASSLTSLIFESRTPELAGVEKVVTQVESARLLAVKNKDGLDDQILILKIRVNDLPNQVDLKAGKADVVLEWPDGTTIRNDQLILTGGADDVSLYSALGIPLPGAGAGLSIDPETKAKMASDAETRAKLAKSAQDAANTTARLPGVRYRRIYHPDRPRSTWMTCWVPVSASIAQRIGREAPACRVAARFETVTPEILGEMPLTAGSRITKRGRVELIGFASYQLRNPRLSGAHGIVSVLQEPGDSSAISFRILDKKTGVIGWGLSSSILVPVAPVIGKIWWAPIDIKVPHFWRTDHWEDAPGWRENVALVAVAFRPAGGFDRQLRSDKLTLVSREEMEELEAVPVSEEDNRMN